MAELEPGAYLQEACQSAQGDRQVLSALVCSQGRAPGHGGELAVTSGAGLSVDVASGNAFVEGTEDGWQGMYLGSNDATLNIVLSAADPTDDRIDLIVMQFRDSTYSGTDDDFVIVDVTGTPSPSPVAPSLPDNSLVLAAVLVEAGDTSVTPANIVMGAFYTTCAESGRAYANLGTATTPIAAGGAGDYAMWDGSNALTSEFTLQAGSGGADQVLKYHGPGGWFMAYCWATFANDAATFILMRVFHYDAASVLQADTESEQRYGSPPDYFALQMSPLLYLSTGDLLSVYLNVGSSASSPVDVTHQMRVAAL